jgi:XTP/dITP diphosphohydrolase
MKELTYITGNAVKFRQAVMTCEPLGITLVQQSGLDIPEIQAESGEVIACDKAAKAFATLQKPLVVSDDSWTIPGLKGFPGPYMKYVNDWFTIDDWLNLTRNLTDRRIILQQIVVYHDANGQQVFSEDIAGILLTEPRGNSPYPHSAITSFDDGEHSNAEYHEKGESAAAHHPNPWHKFAAWYSKQS